jgi:lysyl-tRNA synthetase class II
MAVLFTALANNRGLLDLDLSNNFRMNDDSLSILCESLKAHPTLLTLNLPTSHAGLTDKRKINRTRLLAEIVLQQNNTVLHTIRL